MKVTDDPFYRGLVVDPIFGGTGGTMTEHVAYLIFHGRGTQYERQRYTFEEYRWACHILGKPCDRTQ